MRQERASWVDNYLLAQEINFLMLSLIFVDNVSISWAQICKEEFLDSYINLSVAIHLEFKNPKTAVWFIANHPRSTMSRHIELFEMASGS